MNRSISLDPADQEKLASSNRRAVLKARKEGYTVGPFGPTMGAPLAIANGLLAYHLMKGTRYSLLPFTKAKLPSVGIILAASFIGFNMGCSVVQSIVDTKKERVSFKNKSQYMNGSGPLDPLVSEKN